MSAGPILLHARRHMLDTNIVSYILKGHHPPASQRAAANAGSLCVSAVTEFELLFGLHELSENHRVAVLVGEFLARVQVLPWDRPAAASCAQLRHRLEKAGTPLSTPDLFIAAHAVAIGATLVTHDKAFRHVPGLAIVDWTKP